MAGQILKAAVRLLATTIAAFSFLAAQPQGIAAFSGTIAGGDSDSAMTGTGPTSPQPAAKIPGSGNGPVAPTRGGTGTGGGTKGGTNTGAGTNTPNTTGTNTAPTPTGGDNTPTGTVTTGDTGTNNTVDEDVDDQDQERNDGNAVQGVQNPPTVIAPAAEKPLDNSQLGTTSTGGAVAGTQMAGAQQQGGAVAGLQSLPSTSSPAGSPLGALTALAGALYAITRRSKS